MKRIGNVCAWFINVNQQGDRVDEETGRMELEIGYDFIPEMWGKGYATEATSFLLNRLRDIQFGFEYSKLVAFTHAQNIASHKVLQKSGFVRVNGSFRYLKEENCLKFEKVIS
eukprot:TRINITY_DN12832_c0_g1_i1.p1 TRINITY_DN12832_c0_g1~~TRINITY_DN12832_c0_g1_i1.p1  ORF type:complete len:113 (+),score=14.21 TRINITY_DN12832_c0_g1_i1:2-340(+)